MRGLGSVILRAAVVGAVLATTMVAPAGAAGAGAAGAAGAGAAAAPSQQGKRCYIVLDKLAPGQKASRVLSSECVTGSQPRTTQAGTLLMRWYEHVQFGGIWTSVEGNAGPCDSDGYGFSQLGPYWSTHISSWGSYNNCLWTIGWSGFNYTGDTTGWQYGYQQPFLGRLNDNTRSIKISGG